MKIIFCITDFYFFITNSIYAQTILNQKWFSRSRQFLTVVNYCFSDSWKLLATYFCRKPKLTEYKLENNQEILKDSTQIGIAPTFFDKVMDLIEFSNEASRQNDSTRFRSKFVLSPVLVYKPATSFGFGVGGT
jgi:hypothetical protein